MGMIYSFLMEITANPVISSFILLISWIWIKLYLEEWNIHNFSSSYLECIQKKQYWKIFLSSISHKSVFHLLLSIMVLWNCRSIETKYGSFYIFKYSMVLILSEKLLSFFLIYLTITYTFRGNMLLIQMISNSLTMGCSGLCLSWLAYQSIDFTMNIYSRMFLLFGLFSFEPYLAPLIMIFIYLIYLSKHYLFSHLSALITGYLLVSGLLLCLPNLYWSVCFFIDVSLIITSSLLLKDENLANYISNRNTDEHNMNDNNQNNVLNVIDLIDESSRMINNNTLTETTTTLSNNRQVRSLDATNDDHIHERLHHNNSSHSQLISLSEFQRIQEEEDLEQGLLQAN